MRRDTCSAQHQKILSLTLSAVILVYCFRLSPRRKAKAINAGKEKLNEKSISNGGGFGLGLRRKRLSGLKRSSWGEQ